MERDPAGCDPAGGTREAILHLLLRAPLIALALGCVPVCAALVALGFRRAGVWLWCWLSGRALGLRITRVGPEPPDGSLVACNHVGYLDIFALGAACPGRFVAKSEIAGWPLMGLVARVAGTIFVERERPRAVLGLIEEFSRRLAGGERILLYPEAGVGPDGRNLGTFHPMLFEPCVRARRPCVPAAVRFTEPADPRVWSWLDGSSLVWHIWARLMPARRVRAEVRFGHPLWPLPGEGRKELAERARREVERLLAA